MVREDELQCAAPCGESQTRLSFDYHSLTGNCLAGCHWLAVANYLNQAHSTITGYRQSVVVTEDGDLDSYFAGSTQDGGAVWHLNFPIIDGQQWHVLISPIELAADHVDGIKGWNDVGQHPALEHVWQTLHQREAGGPHMKAVRSAPSVGDEVVTEFTVAALHESVSFATWNLGASKD
jgi:hypothetical protein